MKRIGVIGIPGKWSTETLADAIEQRTGFRLVVDMNNVSLDLADNKLHYLEADKKVDLSHMGGNKQATQSGTGRANDKGEGNHSIYITPH